MGKKFEAARVRVRVPPRKWKNKGEVEAWAREQLAGGPPRLRGIVPPSHPEAGKPATWKHLKEGVFGNQFVVLESDPPGLIIEDSVTGGRRFVPTASRSGLVLGKTKADEFIGSIDMERELRAFVKEENRSFNKREQAHAEGASRNWTLEWYQHGRRIRQFADRHSEVSTERIWQELVKWGRGQNGYSRQTHQDSTYFYDWLGEMMEDHPVFRLSTTRIQHILWADRIRAGRDRLLAAIIRGQLGNLSDDEFAWIVGKRKKNWPLEPALREELISLGVRIRAGLSLTKDESLRLAGLLERARVRFPEEADALTNPSESTSRAWSGRP